MNKTVKWILIIGGGCSLIVFAALVVIFILVDVQQYKPEIQSMVFQATGRELTLGNIRLKVSFTPSLVMDDMSFQNASWGSRPELARIKRFEIKVALLPLIGGQIDIRRFYSCGAGYFSRDG